MNSFRIVRAAALASICACISPATASAQPASKPSPDEKGQPGPQDYKRSHADGANMLADALAPHHGVVMWRAFVYRSALAEDRVRQSYDEFAPLDGHFRSNVLLQTKNGPLDFQPRESFHPLFGAMPQTAQMIEFQITKEYLGEDSQGERMLTDSRGIPTAADAPVHNGAIFRIVRARQADDDVEDNPL